MPRDFRVFEFNLSIPGRTNRRMLKVLGSHSPKRKSGSTVIHSLLSSTTAHLRTFPLNSLLQLPGIVRDILADIKFVVTQKFPQVSLPCLLASFFRVIDDLFRVRLLVLVALCFCVFFWPPLPILLHSKSFLMLLIPLNLDL
jgi:hypothetical protein